MPNSILSYEVENVPGRTTLSLPVDSTGKVNILSVEERRGVVYLFVKTDLVPPEELVNAKTKETDIYCALTGVETVPNPDSDKKWRFFTTVDVPSNPSFFIHVYVLGWDDKACYSATTTMVN